MSHKAAFTDITGVVLVGGKGRRMGRDKVLIPVHGKPIIEKTFRKIAPLFAETLVVGHHRPEFDELKIQSHPDIIPDCGALGGIYTGLALAQTPFIFAIASDMPFLDTDLMTSIAEVRQGADAVIPKGSMGYEPLFAIYSTSCLNQIRENLEKGSLRVLEALEGMNVLNPEIPPVPEGAPDPLSNLNTPQDLRLLEE
ncbi:MAG: molybdenum cofactor guanylyltransferase [bacterium]